MSAGDGVQVPTFVVREGGRFYVATDLTLSPEGLEKLRVSLLSLLLRLPAKIVGNVFSGWLRERSALSSDLVEGILTALLDNGHLLEPLRTVLSAKGLSIIEAGGERETQSFQED